MEAFSADQYSPAAVNAAPDQAVSLQERLAGEFEVIVTSPRHFMVRGFDRASVDMLVSCLRAGLATGGMPDEDEAGVKSMLEDFETWLGQAEE